MLKPWRIVKQWEKMSKIEKLQKIKLFFSQENVNCMGLRCDKCPLYSSIGASICNQKNRDEAYKKELEKEIKKELMKTIKG